MTREELQRMVEELKTQDEELERIFKERKEIAKKARESNQYMVLWEMLFSDKKSHYDL